MASSTSHSNSRFPARAVLLLLTAAVVWGLSIAYTLRWSPEVRNWLDGAAIKIHWAEKMTREHGPKILVYGGSSCSFSIDGERMLDRFGLPTVNFGRTADMGPTVLTESVLGCVRPGDTLIVAIEPGLLTRSFDVPALGVQFSYAMGHPEWVRHPHFGEPGVGQFQALAALRPGGYHSFTMLGKIVRGGPLFRYQPGDYHPSGWEQTEVRREITGPAQYDARLSNNARTFLSGLRAWCEQRRVRVAYSLPWGYCPPDKMKAFQEKNIELLLQANEYIPVLKDAHLGADTNLDHFADTDVHLTVPAAALRTDEFAGQIKNWDIWTAAALRQRQAQLADTAD